MRCPRCGCENCHIITETQSYFKGYGFCKGCFGALCLGPAGWLCGLLGMGKGQTSSTTYWVCNDCGYKFKV